MFLVASNFALSPLLNVSSPLNFLAVLFPFANMILFRKVLLDLLL
jgi:hypothetical protein